MEMYLRAFINGKQNNWSKLLPIAKFTYNNAKNTSTSHTLFKFNYSYYSIVLFKKDVNFCLKSCSTNKLVENQRELIEVCYQNLLHV